MNKKIIYILLSALFLTACSEKESWETEEVKEVSDQIITDDVKVLWSLGSNGNNGKDTLIRLKVMKNEEETINDFDINHEKLLHLIIISKDLSYFNHVHPEYKGDGVFEITNDFPAGGEYRMIADFKPTDGNSMSKMEWVQVQGNPAKAQPVKVDKEWEKTVDGNQVRLTMDELAAKKSLNLKFHFTDEKTGKPITDLQPYLGSIGHVVVLSEDGERYLHVHALEDQGAGPEALFETEFPKSGTYKIWGQFQREGKVFTVSYVVEVP